MSSSTFMPEVAFIDNAIPCHHLYYLEDHDLELLGIDALGCPPLPMRVDEYIAEELGLDIDSPMFKWDVDSLIEDYIQQLPDDHPYFRDNASPEPLPIPPHLPSIAQLELGEELAEEIPRLPSPLFAEFPTVSAFASEESDTPSTPTSWSPVSDDPLMCDMGHPGSPWERYDFCMHPTYIMIPAGPEGDQIFHQAPFIQFKMHHITGEPKIMGTNGSGCSVHSEPLFAAPNPGPTIADDTKFAYLKEPQVTGEIDAALVRLNDPGVQVEVIRLRQKAERRRALMHEYDGILAMERSIVDHCRQWNYEPKTLEDRVMGARIRLTNAHINSHIHPYITNTRTTNHVWDGHVWTAERLRGGHLTSSGGDDGCTSKDPPVKCRFCLWNHKSKDCDTHHYLCSRRMRGRCMVSKKHDGYWNQMPTACPFKGRNKQKAAARQPDIFIRAEKD
jgi:hypothetical protein